MQGKMSTSYTLHGHKDGGSTACPGTALYYEIRTWPRFAGPLQWTWMGENDIFHDSRSIDYIIIVLLGKVHKKWEIFCLGRRWTAEKNFKVNTTLYCIMVNITVYSHFFPDCLHELLPDRFFWATCFLFLVFFIFFVSVPCGSLSWS